jgi:hypothetical protein
VSGKKAAPTAIAGRDPNSFPVPIVGVLAPAGTASAEITTAGSEPPVATISADGGRTTTRARGRR